MPENVSYDADAKLLRVHAWGLDAIENWYSSRQEVSRLAELHGVFQLLVDVRQVEVGPSVFDMFDFGDDWPAKIKVAILFGKTTPEDYGLMETVANIRSKNMKVFFSEDEALIWLRE